MIINIAVQCGFYVVRDMLWCTSYVVISTTLRGRDAKLRLHDRSSFDELKGGTTLLNAS